MRLIAHVAIFVTLLPVVSTAANVIPPPFAWSKSFMVTLMERSKTSHTQPFVNAYSQDNYGQKARNQFVTNNVISIKSFRLDEHKRITISPDGAIWDSKLPSDWPVSNMFPKNRPWALQGTDNINGLSALKYKIFRDRATVDLSQRASYVTMWLSADNKTPILWRMVIGWWTSSTITWGLKTQTLLR